MSHLSTAQLRRYLSLTEEAVVERLEEDTLAEKVERVVDIAERFMADPRDVSPAEVTEAKALLASMRHYDRALAPIRKLQLSWRNCRLAGGAETGAIGKGEGPRASLPLR